MTSGSPNIELVEGRRYDTGEPVRIRIGGGKILSVEPAWPAKDAEAWPYVAPGLFDLQVNGYGGIWFSSSSLTPAEVIQAIEPYFAFGVTRLCPTLITNSFASLSAGFRAIREACESHSWVEEMIPGCHLEGPYLSPEDGPRGAHPKIHVRPADWDEFQKLQEASGGRIRLLTLAPEAPGAIEFIRRAVASGVTVAIGHTAATGAQIQESVEAGARLSTHLGNGAHAVLRRHPNYIWEQLGDSRLTASLITDGQHLPCSVARSMIRTKSPRGIVLTCDASGWAGCIPGRYRNELGEVEVLPDGRIVVAGQDQLLAGSSAGTHACVARAIEMGGISLGQAIDMACRNPSRLLGFEEICLRRGSRADLTLFRQGPLGESLAIEATIASGRLRFGALRAL